MVHKGQSDFAVAFAIAAGFFVDPNSLWSNEQRLVDTDSIMQLVDIVLINIIEIESTFTKYS